jgi:hypothetical protein
MKLKSIELKKNYFTKVAGRRRYSVKNSSFVGDWCTIEINPYFITGFTDAEGCFMVSIYKRIENKVGWQIKPEFKIGLHSKDLHILERIQSYLGVGKIITKGTRTSFEVKNLQEISEVIIPHFELYPLISEKFADYCLFKSTVELILRKQHLSKEGLIKIVSLKSSLNLGLSPDLEKSFPVIVPEVRLKPSIVIDPNWLVGFISGEGCFYIGISKDGTKRTGFSVNLWFLLSQHSRDKVLMSKIMEYLACGNLRFEDSMVRLRVSKFSDITDKIFPLLDKHSVEGVKYFDYLDIKRVAELIKSKAHLTPKGLIKIRSIKEGMNKGRGLVPNDLTNLEKEDNEEDEKQVDSPPTLLPYYPQKNSLVWCSNNLKSHERIGPHNLNIISLIVGSLLSNSYLEKRSLASSVRLVFIKYSNNVEYLVQFHLILIKAGYCNNNNQVKLNKFIGKGNKVLFVYIFKSYSFASLMWLFEMFYGGYTADNVKIIPRNLYEYLTPLALATLFLSSSAGTVACVEKAILNPKGLLDRCLVTVNDLEYLSLVLYNKYNIETYIVFNNSSRFIGGSLYIKNISAFSKIVKPHLLSSQYNLLSRPTIKLNIFGGIRRRYIYSGCVSAVREYSTTIKIEISDIKYSNKFKKEYELSLEQKEAIIGIMLGDGHLIRAKPTHNARLQIDQSYPEKEQYIMSLYKLLEPLTAMSPTILTRKDKRSGSVTQSKYFRTLSMPCLNYYHEIFYNNKVKIVPRNLGKLLTARGLAFFIMDDGGKSVYNQTILHTRAYSLDDVKFIQSVLFENFELKTRLEEKKKDQWVIFIPVRQKNLLKDIVGPFIHESMLYKI